jgi:hypothetical protein
LVKNNAAQALRNAGFVEGTGQIAKKTQRLAAQKFQTEVKK